jgi:hypothetical protein
MNDRAQREAHWREHVGAWRASGLSRKAYCAAHGLSIDSLGYWQQRLSSAQPTVRASRSAAQLTLVAGMIQSPPEAPTLTPRTVSTRSATRPRTPAGTEQGRKQLMAWEPGQPIRSAQDEADRKEWKRRTKAEGQRYRRSQNRRIDYADVSDDAALIIDPEVITAQREKRYVDST